MEKTSQYSEKLLHRKLDLLLRTGKLLMESAADTSRIMRNMKRTAAYLGLPDEHLHIYINYNMLMVNLGDEEHSFSKFQSCEKHGINMTAISAVSKLSWRAIREDYSLEKYEEELEKIRTRKRNYTPWQVAVGAGFACGGFCIQFGCDWPASFYASVAAILGFRLRAVLNDLGSNHFMNIAVAAFVSTLLAWVSTFISTLALPGPLHAVLHSDTPWHPLMACALFIVPGVPLINFVSDMLDNYVQVGITRAVNTLLIVVAMSFGIALAIHVCGIDNFVKDLSMTPHHTYFEFRHIGRRIFDDLQYPAPVALGGGRRRRHRRLLPQLCQSWPEQPQYRTGHGSSNRFFGRLGPYQHHRNAGGALVPHPSPLPIDSQRHPDDPGRADESGAVCFHRYARRGGRSHRSDEQCHPGLAYDPLHRYRRGHPEHFCTPLDHSQTSKTVETAHRAAQAAR